MKISFSDVETLLAFEIHKKCIDDSRTYIQISLKNKSLPADSVILVEGKYPGDPITLYNGEIEISLYDNTEVTYISSSSSDEDGKKIWHTSKKSLDLRCIIYDEIYIITQCSTRPNGPKKYTIMVKN